MSARCKFGTSRAYLALTQVVRMRVLNEFKCVNRHHHPHSIVSPYLSPIMRKSFNERNDNATKKRNLSTIIWKIGQLASV
uniref:Uncharacterized protein n=1 Tax=Parascaris univalens TaxID=6257 RepID=A0A915B4B5_PARUN